MGEFGGFVLSLLAVACASALLDGFVPEGGMKKYLKVLLSLIVLLVLLSPLTKLCEAVPAWISGENFIWDSAEAMAKANSIAALHIEKAVQGKFDCEAEVSLESGNILVEAKPKPGLFASDIERYIEFNFGMKAEVIFCE